MKTYEVTAERDGKFWFIRIPELDGVTQALTEEEIPVMARDYIAVTLDVPANSFEIAIGVRSDAGRAPHFGPNSN